jgi:hypothetical protein
MSNRTSAAATLRCFPWDRWHLAGGTVMITSTFPHARYSHISRFKIGTALNTLFSQMNNFSKNPQFPIQHPAQQQPASFSTAPATTFEQAFFNT